MQKTSGKHETTFFVKGNDFCVTSEGSHYYLWHWVDEVGWVEEEKSFDSVDAAKMFATDLVLAQDV